MSRKTRKLIWSAPLVAVLAIAGALAIFAALGPNLAQATHEMLPGPPTDLSVEPAEGNAGRTTLVLTWKAPENSTVTGYRIDYSTDNVEYKELVPNSGSTATTYTHTGLDSGKMYVYRVFAINNAGTGLVSETYSNSTNGPAGKPDDVIGLTAARAATTPEKWSEINLSWTEPYGGGKKITGYCIETVDDPTPWPAAAAGCRAATIPSADVPFVASADGVAAGTVGITLTGDTMTTHTDEGLDAGERRFYRVFALTGAIVDGTDGRAVSGMPSNVASAITAHRENPMPPGTVRAAENVGRTDVILYWYWPASNGGMDVSNFRVEVTTNPNSWPNPSDTDTGADANAFDGTSVTNAVGTTPAEHDDGVLTPVTAAAAQTVSATAQATHTHAVPEAVTNKRLYYRVFTETGTAANNDVLRSSPSNVVSIVVNDGLSNTASNPTTPLFTDSATDDDTGADGGKGEIGLTWKAGLYDDPNDDPDAGATVPYAASGYRIDYALGTDETPANDLLKWKPLWGNTGFTRTQFTHQSLKPETRVYYRVFAIGSAQAISSAAGPQNATTDEAGALAKVRNVRAMADNPTQITVTWDVPADTSADDIERYNVQQKMLGTADPALTEFEKTESGSVTTYVHKKLSESQTWLYRVAAVEDGRTTDPAASEYSEWVTATTPEAGKPDMPIGLVAEDARDSSLTAPGDRGVLLIWNMPMGPAGSEVEMYKIERKVMGKDDDFKPLMTTDGIRTTDTDKDEPKLDEGEVRYYRVAAVSKTRLTGEWATVRFPTDLMMVPDAPTMLSATKDADMPTSQINLTWTAPDMADATVTGYIIERAYGDVMFLDADDGVAHPDYAFSDHMEWWETLNCAGMLNAVGSDADPDMDSDDKAMYCKHYAMSGPTADMTFPAEKLIAADSDVDMKIEEYFNKRYEVITDATAMSHEDTGLMPNTEYSYRIRAAHGMYAGMWSNTAMAMTEAEAVIELSAPDTVTAMLDPDDARMDDVIVTWTGGSGPEGYKVAIGIFTRDFSTLLVDRVVNDATGGTHKFDDLPDGEYVFVVATYHPDAPTVGMSKGSNVVAVVAVSN